MKTRFFAVVMLSWLSSSAWGADNPWVVRNAYAGDTLQLLYTTDGIPAGTVREALDVGNGIVKISFGGHETWIDKTQFRRYYTPAECEARGMTYEQDFRSYCPATDSMVVYYQGDDDAYLFKVCIHRDDEEDEPYWNARNANIPGVCYPDSD